MDLHGTIQLSKTGERILYFISEAEKIMDQKPETDFPPMKEMIYGLADDDKELQIIIKTSNLLKKYNYIDVRYYLTFEGRQYIEIMETREKQQELLKEVNERLRIMQMKKEEKMTKVKIESIGTVYNVGRDFIDNHIDKYIEKTNNIEELNGVNATALDIKKLFSGHKDGA